MRRRKKPAGRRLPHEEWPADLQRPEVRGVYLYGCVERGPASNIARSAHAHTSGPYRRWICFKGKPPMENRETILHELAHVISGEGHTKRFRAVLVELGGTLTGYDHGGVRGMGRRAAQAAREENENAQRPTS